MIGARFGELAVMAYDAVGNRLHDRPVKGPHHPGGVEDVIGRKKHPAPELVRLARNLQIEFGDPVEP
jgi:hypothetical protein